MKIRKECPTAVRINFLLVKILTISKVVNIFKKNIKAPFELNLEKDFFSQDYHQDIFFYVYSNISKKIIAQGGGYQYKKNLKKVEGFGFSCNVDYIAELI